MPENFSKGNHPRPGRAMIGKSCVIGAVWLFAAVIVLAGCHVQAATLNEIDHAYHNDERGEYYRIVLHLSSIPRHSVRVSEHSPEMVVELEGARASCPSKMAIRDPRSPVSEIRIESGGERIYLELERVGVRPKTMVLSDPDRLVLDLYAGDAPGPTDFPRAEVPPKDTAAPKSSGRNYKIIVIDPGHGGWDTGAKSRYGRYEEKEIVLDISRRLAEYFRRSKNYRAFLTRDRDVLPFVEGKEPDPKDKVQRKALRGESLAGRIEFANRKFRVDGQECDADLFVSIHVNAARNRRARGFEVWIPGDEITQDEQDRALLLAENAENGEGMLWDRVPVIDGDSARVLLSMVGDKMNKWNPLLALHIDKQMRRVDEGSFQTRGVKKGPFRVLRNLTMPSVLVEVGFISSQSEVSQHLSQDWFRQRVAHALYTAINDFFLVIDGLPPERVEQPKKPRQKYETYVVRKGDSLYKIGRRYRISYERIKKLNQLKSDRLRPGQELKIPQRSAS